MQALIPRGELKRRARQKNLLTDALMASDRNDLSDIQIITLKQWLKEQAYEQAWVECTFPGDIEAYAQHLLETEFTHAKEFVDINAKIGIQIGVNVSEIDDNAIDQAIFLLSQVESLTTIKMHQFGDRVKINAT